jgi:hypothetical protein
MNPIDQMLLDYSNKIEIHLVPNPKIFKVFFSAYPSPEVLSPILSLVETQRFAWGDYTEYELESKKLGELLCLAIKSINVIPCSAAIKTLTKMWEEMGYKVTMQTMQVESNITQTSKLSGKK